jgi:recombination protein RecR
MDFSSELIAEGVKEFSKLPGIGKRSALRLVLHLLKENPDYTNSLADNLKKMREQIKLCKLCYNYTDTEICTICTSHKRDKSVLCVVVDTRDIMAIENTAQYRGIYHVLGGVISPVDGIGPQDLKINELLARIPNSEITEVILALSPTMEGDTTAFYLSKKLKELGIKTSTIARGIPVGGELEYADELTLGRSILNRTALV